MQGSSRWDSPPPHCSQQLQPQISALGLCRSTCSAGGGDKLSICRLPAVDVVVLPHQGLGAWARPADAQPALEGAPSVTKPPAITGGVRIVPAGSNQGSKCCTTLGF